MIDVAIPLFLVACGVAVIFVKDLMSSIMIFSIYSLVMAIEWVRLNAVDVAITEAAVGAGISTVLFMAVLSRTRSVEKVKGKPALPALLIAGAVAALLLYGTADLPGLRDPNLAPSAHVAPKYISDSYQETGVTNVVTAVLASYRGYDTLGETTVVSTAGFCLVLLLRQLTKKRDGGSPAKGVDKS